MNIGKILWISAGVVVSAMGIMIIVHKQRSKNAEKLILDSIANSTSVSGDSAKDIVELKAFKESFYNNYPKDAKPYKVEAIKDAARKINNWMKPALGSTDETSIVALLSSSSIPNQLFVSGISVEYQKLAGKRLIDSLNSKLSKTQLAQIFETLSKKPLYTKK